MSDKRIAICPGSFDPITLGHLNIIRRSAQIFDEVVVCVMLNATKTSPMFTIDERVGMVRRAVVRYANVRVDTAHVLLAEYARQYDNAVIVFGLRIRIPDESDQQEDQPCSGDDVSDCE